ncbi:MAG: YraN family protein [Cytophagales bacterium]
MNSTSKGKQGEAIAEKYLVKKGFQVLERNYRYKRSEIDLIAFLDNCVVFIEVKLRKNASFGFPEEFVTQKKAELIKMAAENYVFDKDWHGNIRFDIISILKTHLKEELLHLQDAF